MYKQTVPSLRLLLLIQMTKRNLHISSVPFYCQKPSELPWQDPAFIFLDILVTQMFFTVTLPIVVKRREHIVFAITVRFT